MSVPISQTLNDAVAAEIRADRAAAQISQKELAVQSGLSESTIIRVELGRVAINVEHIDAICLVFGVEPEDLMTRARMRRARAEAGTRTPAQHP